MNFVAITNEELNLSNANKSIDIESSVDFNYKDDNNNVMIETKNIDDQDEGDNDSLDDIDFDDI